MAGSSSIPAARLAVLLPEFPAQTHAFFWREIQALRSAGVDTSIFSTRRPQQEACPHEWAPEARRETTYLFPPQWLRSLSWLILHPAQATRALEYVAGLRESSALQRLKLLGLVAPAIGLLRQCRTAGIAHVHCHSFANAAHVCALARVMGGPGYSLTLHGDLQVYGKDHAAKLRECLAVTTAGLHLVDQVAALGFAGERILSNPMGVDTARFAPRETDAAAEGALPLRLITVARLNRNKGHRFALAAMQRLIEAGIAVTYTIVGEGPYRTDLEREIRERHLEGQVTLAGGQGEAQVIELLHEHDVFVLPSVGLGEAAPVSVMEAMSCGLPVVASVIGSTPAMIRDAETGFLVPQEDAAALERVLASLAADPALRKKIGDAARAAALGQFSAESSSLRLLEHLRRCGAQV